MENRYRSVFLPADILMPQVDSLEKWAVIACDQFTSQPEYWERVQKKVGEQPSTFHMILPEAFLKKDNRKKTEEIHETMKQYIQNGLFRTYEKAYVYVERKLSGGKIRRGLVGVIDLEAYDYRAGSHAAVRVTEKTVEERIPPRKAIRQGAPLELPHVLLLCDDEDRDLIEPLTQRKTNLTKLYGFELMEEGGYIEGWLVQGADAQALDRRLERYAGKMAVKYAMQEEPVLFAVGDGNHSLAAARACYEDLKRRYPDRDFSDHPARYAMAELENIHDEVQQFEPIHRIVKGTDPEDLLARMREEIGAEEGMALEWCAGEKSGTIYLDRKKGKLPTAILQTFLDSYLSSHAGTIDYIHGDETLKALARREGSAGFLLPAMEKTSLFPGIISEGVLPRKTFSMGQAQEKRYYLETRKIQ